MSELGKRLRLAREEKSLTLDELQKITRIQKRYLAAIEEGKYDIMPGKFYTRAFIKQYAEAVDLEPEILFEEYKNEIPLANEDVFPEQLSRVQTRSSLSKRNSRIMNLIPKLLIVIFVIFIIVLVWYLVQKYGNFSNPQMENEGEQAVGIEESEEIIPTNPDDDESLVDDETNDENEETEKETKEEVPQQEITLVGVSGTTTTYQVTNAEKFEITIKAIPGDSSWVRVTNNKEETYLSKEIKDGESETFDLTGEEEAFIRVGRSSAAEIYVNDEKIEYQIDATVQNIIIQYIPIE